MLQPVRNTNMRRPQRPKGRGGIAPVKMVSSRIQCDRCDKTFRSVTGLRHHQQHHTGQYSYSCGLCRRGFVQTRDYEHHMRGHEGRGYPCEFCGKVLKSSQSLKYHLSEHTGQYLHSCIICKRGYNEKRKLLEHMKQHR